MDQLSPSRPAAAPTAPAAPTGEEVSVPKAKPKADPVPPAFEAEADDARKPSWRTRLLMFGVPLALLVGGGWYWLTSGGAVSTDNAYVQMRCATARWSTRVSCSFVSTASLMR